MTPSPEDFLSDAEAEVMDRAMAGPHAWANYDAGVCPLGVRADDRAEWYASRLAAIRRAWAARPSTAKNLDRITILAAKHGIDYHLGAEGIDRGRHLLTGAPPNG